MECYHEHWVNLITLNSENKKMETRPTTKWLFLSLKSWQHPLGTLYTRWQQVTKAYKIILFEPFARNKNCIIYQQIIQPNYLIIFLPNTHWGRKEQGILKRTMTNGMSSTSNISFSCHCHQRQAWLFQAGQRTPLWGQNKAELKRRKYVQTSFTLTEILRLTKSEVSRERLV